MASPLLKKIVKVNGQAPTEVELQVAQALVDLEIANKDLDLGELQFVSAKEVVDAAGKKSIVVFVPYRQHRRFQKVQQRLVRELEKKTSKHIAVIAQRTILSKNYSRQTGGQLRSRSRTLTTVHEAILDDLVYPTQIVGKRTRVGVDGSRLLKVYLDAKDAKDIEYKLQSFAAIYQKLTNKKTQFLFPSSE